MIVMMIMLMMIRKTTTAAATAAAAAATTSSSSLTTATTTTTTRTVSTTQAHEATFRCMSKSRSTRQFAWCELTAPPFGLLAELKEHFCKRDIQ